MVATLMCHQLLCKRPIAFSKSCFNQNFRGKWFTPLTTNMTLENPHFQWEKTPSNGGFSIVMQFFFWGGYSLGHQVDLFLIFDVQKILYLPPRWFGSYLVCGFSKSDQDIDSNLFKFHLHFKVQGEQWRTFQKQHGKLFQCGDSTLSDFSWFWTRTAPISYKGRNVNLMIALKIFI